MSLGGRGGPKPFPGSVERRRGTPDPESRYLPGVVEAFARDLKSSLETDPDEARRLLGNLLGHITLRRDGEHLKAAFQGRLSGLLDVEAMGRTLVPEEGLEPPRV